MKFEEQFPSLKYRRIIAQEYLDADCIDTHNVEKYCLDKQMVKDAFNPEKMKEVFLQFPFSEHHIVIKRILEELGLDK